MNIPHTVIRFAVDGTIAASMPGTPVIVPGMDALWECEAAVANGADVDVLDLTNARLVWTLVGTSGAVGMWCEDAPFFTVTDATHGLFTVTIVAAQTALLTPGTYTLEIKAAYPSGTLLVAAGPRVRIAYTTIAVTASALAGQP